MKNRDAIISAIVESELDGMELDALMDFYHSERTASLGEVDDDTLQNIAQELMIETEE